MNTSQVNSLKKKKEGKLHSNNIAESSLSKGILMPSELKIMDTTIIVTHLTVFQINTKFIHRSWKHGLHQRKTT